VTNTPNSISAGALPQTPLGELTALPQTPQLRCPTSKGRGRGGEGRGKGEKGKGEREWEREEMGRRGREGKGRKGRGREGEEMKGEKLIAPNVFVWPHPWSSGEHDSPTSFPQIFLGKAVPQMSGQRETVIQ